MSYEVGVPQNPILVTIDGDMFYVFQCIDIVRDNKPHKKMILEVFDWVMSRHDWGKNDLQYDISPRGTITRIVPTSSVFISSNNPAKPIWILLTTIENEEINWENPSIYPIVSYKSQIDKLTERVADLLIEVKSLRNENRRLLSLTKDKRKEFDDAFGSKIETPLIPMPPEKMRGFEGKVAG